MPNLLAGCRGSVPSPSSTSQPLPHFQSSMLLHNLSSVFFSQKESQPARPALHPRPAPHDRHGASVHRSAPDRARRPLSTGAAPALHRRCPGAAPARPTLGPQQTAPALSTAKQVFHRVFHIFVGFPQRLSFPLAFFERNSVRSSAQLVLTAQ